VGCGQPALGPVHVAVSPLQICGQGAGPLPGQWVTSPVPFGWFARAERGPMPHWPERRRAPLGNPLGGPDPRLLRFFGIAWGRLVCVPSTGGQLWVFGLVVFSGVGDPGHPPPAGWSDIASWAAQLRMLTDFLIFKRGWESAPFAPSR